MRCQRSVEGFVYDRRAVYDFPVARNDVTANAEYFIAVGKAPDESQFATQNIACDVQAPGVRRPHEGARGWTKSVPQQDDE
jgi:hypothetical protein